MKTLFISYLPRGEQSFTRKLVNYWQSQIPNDFLIWRADSIVNRMFSLCRNTLSILEYFPVFSKQKNTSSFLHLVPVNTFSSRQTKPWRLFSTTKYKLSPWIKTSSVAFETSIPTKNWTFFITLVLIVSETKLPKLSPFKDPVSIILNGSWQLIKRMGTNTSDRS